MGFLKKLLGRENEGGDPFGGARPAEPHERSTPDPFGHESPAAGADISTPVVSFQSQPMEASWSSVTINGQPATPDQAQAFTQAFEQMGNLASLGSSQVVDLRGVPGLRDKVLGAMQQHANDPAAMQNALLDAFRNMGSGTPGAAHSGATPPPGEGDPLDRLRKLDELRDQGVLTDAEFAEQKRKLLDEL